MYSQTRSLKLAGVDHGLTVNPAASGEISDPGYREEEEEVVGVSSSLTSVL